MDSIVHGVAKSRTHLSDFQWLGLCNSIAGSAGSIPDQGTKIPQTTQCGQKQTKNPKTKENCKKPSFSLLTTIRPRALPGP